MILFLWQQLKLSKTFPRWFAMLYLYCGRHFFRNELQCLVLQTTDSHLSEGLPHLVDHTWVTCQSKSFAPGPEDITGACEGLESYFQPLHVASKPRIVDVHVGAVLVAIAPIHLKLQVMSFEHEVANLMP